MLRHRFNGAAVLAASNVLARACAFAVIVVAARLLETEDFAVILLAQALTQYLLVALDFGLTLTGIRIIASDPSAVRQIMGATLLIRVAVAVLGLLIIAVGTWFASTGADVVAVVMAFSLVAVATSLDVSWIAQALGSTRLRAGVTAGSAILGLTVLVVVLPIMPTPLAVAGSQLTGVAIGVGLGLVAIIVRYGRPAAPSKAVARSVVLMAVPLGLASLLAQVYYNVDLLLLGLWRPLVEVAAYGAAYKILLGLLMLVWTYAGVALPRLAKAFGHGAGPFGAELRRDLLTAVAFTLPMAMGLGLLAEPVMTLLFGPEFASGATPLRILLISLPLAAFRTILLYSFTAAGRPWSVPLSSAPGAVVNFGLNVLLIPEFGMMAAAITTVVAEAVVTGVAVWQGRGVLRALRPESAQTDSDHSVV